MQFVEGVLRSAAAASRSAAHRRAQGELARHATGDSETILEDVTDADGQRRARRREAMARGGRRGILDET
jgi:hypothetical protein